jgi:hypothetical protein
LNINSKAEQSAHLAQIAVVQRYLSKGKKKNDSDVVLCDVPGSPRKRVRNQ